MPRPTSMTDWWQLVLTTRANNSVGLLAKLCGVSPRTLHRWQTGNIHMPDLNRRFVIQDVAGPELLAHPQCPRYLRFKRQKNA